MQHSDFVMEKILLLLLLLLIVLLLLGVQFS